MIVIDKKKFITAGVLLKIISLFFLIFAGKFDFNFAFSINTAVQVFSVFLDRHKKNLLVHLFDL